MGKPLPPLKASTIEGICKIIGETSDGLTGPEIQRELLQVNICDTHPGITKWKRLFNALVNYQNKHHCSNAILQLCKNYFAPGRFVNEKAVLFKQQLNSFNRIMAFEGWQITESGVLQHHKQSTTISEVDERFNTLKNELTKRNCHQQVFRYCNSELLVENYFHSVEEAVKGLFDRIKELANINSGDGAALIEMVFSSNNPILIINSFQTETEINFQKGFVNLLKGLFSMFRNPRCHTSKIKWEEDKQDSLEIFSIISYCHRVLDNAHRLR